MQGKLHDGAKDGATRTTQVDPSGRGGTMAKVTTARPVVLAAVQAQNLAKAGK